MNYQLADISDVRAGSRRAFSLPLVVMLVLLATIVVSMVLGQQTTTSLAVARHARGYQEHHDAAGMREMITRWLITVRERISDTLDEDGLAFRVQLSQSGLIEVRIADGQGPCLTDTSVLGGRRRVIVERMKECLASLPPETTPTEKRLTREAGPPQISYLTAPERVLQALAVVVVKDKKKAERAAQIMLNREGFATSKSPVRALVAALREQGMDPDEVSDIQGMLTDKNTLWFVTVDMLDQSGRVYSRSGGLYESDTGKNDTFNQSAGFLTWDVLSLE